MSTATPIPRETRQSDVLIATAGQTLFGPSSYRVWDVADVVVETLAVGALSDAWQERTDLTVLLTESGSYSQFTITFDAGLALETKVRHLSRRLHERSTDATKGGAISSAALERELDKQTTVLQETRRDVDSALNPTFLTGPVADAQAARDAAVAARDITTAARDVTTAARDTTVSAKDAAVAANDNVTIKAGEVDTHHSATLAARDAALAAQGLADTAKAASEAARDVATSARDTASTKAGEASTSANAASTAQSAAEAARDATLASLANFLDVYLGGHATAPTLDLDGSPLEAGDLYYNTVSEGMFVYTGTQWVAAYVSGAGGLQAANNLSDLANVGQALINLGLGSVDNTADADKPISNATQTALNLKADAATALLKTANLAGLADLAVARTNLGLGNVDNTADADKPVSTAQQAALNGKESTDTNILRANVSKNLTKGFSSTAHDLGTATTGTITPDPANGNLQKLTNGGTFNLAAPTAVNDYMITVRLTNNASAGPVTITGADFVDGDDFTTVNGDRASVFFEKIDGFVWANRKVLA